MKIQALYICVFVWINELSAFLSNQSENNVLSL